MWKLFGDFLQHGGRKSLSSLDCHGEGIGNHAINKRRDEEEGEGNETFECGREFFNLNEITRHF